MKPPVYELEIRMLGSTAKVMFTSVGSAVAAAGAMSKDSNARRIIVWQILDDGYGEKLVFADVDPKSIETTTFASVVG